MSCDLRGLSGIFPQTRRVSTEDVRKEKDTCSNFRNKRAVHFKLHPQEGKERKNMNIDGVKIPDAWVDITREFSYLEGALRKLSKEHEVGIRIDIDSRHGIFSVDVNNYDVRKDSGKKTYKGVERNVFRDGDITTRGYKYEFKMDGGDTE